MKVGVAKAAKTPGGEAAKGAAEKVAKAAAEDTSYHAVLRQPAKTVAKSNTFAATFFAISRGRISAK
jgi:hypothetical protein